MPITTTNGYKLNRFRAAHQTIKRPRHTCPRCDADCGTANQVISHVDKVHGAPPMILEKSPMTGIVYAIPSAHMKRGPAKPEKPEGQEAQTITEALA